MILRWYKPAWSERFSWWMCWKDGTRIHAGYTLVEAVAEKINIYGSGR